MKRRKAIKQIGLGISAGLIIPDLLMSCTKHTPVPAIKYGGTICIIGAGAAGLYAADQLRSKGLKVFILEASGQLGGRIKSMRNQSVITPSLTFDPTNPTDADFPIELGADTLYGSNSLFGNILQELTIPKIDLGPSIDQYILSSLAKSATDWAADTDYLAVQNFISSLATSTPADVTVLAAANVSTRGQALLNALVGNQYGTTIDRIGAKGLSDAIKLLKRDKQKFLVKTNPWQDILLSRFSEVVPQIILNAPVKSIIYNSNPANTDPIKITDNGGNTYSANKIIVAVPISILKKSGIIFTPGLPGAMTSSLTKFNMDASIRVMIDFKKNFWGDSTGFIWGGTTCPVYLNAGFGRSQYTQTLTMTINGYAAEQLSTQGVNMIPLILAELDAVYAGQATQYVRKHLSPTDVIGDNIYIIQDWSKEEFILGGSAYPLVGATQQDVVNIGTPIANKIFFAGDATDVDGDIGSVNGALNSAERAVADLVKTITA